MGQMDSKVENSSRKETRYSSHLNNSRDGSMNQSMLGGRSSSLINPCNKLVRTRADNSSMPDAIFNYKPPSKVDSTSKKFKPSDLNKTLLKKGVTPILNLLAKVLENTTSKHFNTSVHTLFTPDIRDYKYDSCSLLSENLVFISNLFDKSLSSSNNKVPTEYEQSIDSEKVKKHIDSPMSSVNTPLPTTKEENEIGNYYEKFLKKHENMLNSMVKTESSVSTSSNNNPTSLNSNALGLGAKNLKKVGGVSRNVNIGSDMINKQFFTNRQDTAVAIVSKTCLSPSNPVQCKSPPAKQEKSKITFKLDKEKAKPISSSNANDLLKRKIKTSHVSPHSTNKTSRVNSKEKKNRVKSPSLVIQTTKPQIDLTYKTPKHQQLQSESGIKYTSEILSTSPIRNSIPRININSHTKEEFSNIQVQQKSAKEVSLNSLVSNNIKVAEMSSTFVSTRGKNLLSFNQRLLSPNNHSVEETGLMSDRIRKTSKDGNEGTKNNVKNPNIKIQETQNKNTQPHHHPQILKLSQAPEILKLNQSKQLSAKNNNSSVSNSLASAGSYKQKMMSKLIDSTISKIPTVDARNSMYTKEILSQNLRQSSEAKKNVDKPPEILKGNNTILKQNFDPKDNSKMTKPVLNEAKATQIKSNVESLDKSIKAKLEALKAIKVNIKYDSEQAYSNLAAKITPQDFAPGKHVPQMSLNKIQVTHPVLTEYSPKKEEDDDYITSINFRRNTLHSFNESNNDISLSDDHEVKRETPVFTNISGAVSENKNSGYHSNKRNFVNLSFGAQENSNSKEENELSDITQALNSKNTENLDFLANSEEVKLSTNFHKMPIMSKTDCPELQEFKAFVNSIKQSSEEKTSESPQSYGSEYKVVTQNNLGEKSKVSFSTSHKSLAGSESTSSNQHSSRITPHQPSNTEENKVYVKKKAMGGNIKKF